MTPSAPPAPHGHRLTSFLFHARPHLRARMMLSFGFGALLLVLLGGSIAYFTARNSILNQAVSTAVDRAQASAVLVGQLASKEYSPASVANVLDEVDSAGQINLQCPLNSSLLYMGKTWWEDDVYVFGGTAAANGLDPLPNGPGTVNDTVLLQRHSAEQIINMAPCGAYILIGYAVPDQTNARQDAYYFALYSTQPVNRTLYLLLVALFVAGVATVLAGMVAGRWAAGRVLRPLRKVAAVASAIAEGRLDSRIEPQGAGDLAVLTSSFNTMVDRLQLRIEHDARFASDVSHELRSPLTTLSTALSVIESRREELPDRARLALDLLSAEVARFQAMVRDLLELSRLEAGAVDVQMSLVEVGELVRNALAPTSDGAVPLEIDPELEGRKLTADKRRVERIMTNLINNADRYGGGAVRVAVEDAGDYVRIAVEDEGPGVPEAERQRIFERFARGSVAAGRRGRGGGTGLGLALVTEHVRLHGGRVWVEDREGGGARFVVELPLLDLESEPADPVEPELPSAS